jgi:putative drug exporter of the RND superfamily
VATLLYRLGRFSFRNAWKVIGVWIVLLAGILGGSVALGGQLQESFAIPGTQSQNALDRLQAVFPQVAGASAEAVTVAPEGASVNDPKYTDAINEMAAAIEKIDGIDSVVTPFSQYAGKAVTADHSMAITRVQFEGPSTEVTPRTLTELKDTASIGEDAGLRVEFGGQVFQDRTFGITPTEIFGVLFAGVVLLITFGALLPAGLPLLSALIGVGVVMGGIISVSAFTTVSSTAPLLALMIGLAVGIDYSLFILSRHRTGLAQGEEPQESAAIAVGTAGSAVVFAGITVIIALLGLLVVGIPFLSVMGVGAAFSVLVAIGVATTLLPALLGLAGGKLAPRPGSRAHRRALAHVDGGKPSMGLRWVTGVMKHPIVSSIAVVLVLGTLAIPALSLDLNLPDGGSEPAGSTQREAYDLVSEGFGAGYNGPLVIAVDITQTTDIQQDLDAIGDELRTLKDVSYVSQGLPDAGLDTAIIQVIPDSAPNAIETKALVNSIRDLAPDIEKRFDTPIAVTGATAVGIDISNRLTAALVPFGLIVVGLSILLLMMVFRSVLVPLKAALGFLLSVVASFGVVVAIFQWGWLADVVGVENPGPILSFMPILLMAVLFGLAMDYEVFLVSGMREEFVKTGDAPHAVSRGFAGGARVVTAAALIMFFVFFAFVPEGSGTIKPIALGLAVGIAFDAFLVRMTLVPAIMALIGRAAWWMPRWLGRMLPNMDIEGEDLRNHRAAVLWSQGRAGSVISTENLVVGSAEHRSVPVSVDIPAGALVLVAGSHTDRRAFTWTLAGRLLPVAGRAQVGGHPLPSESDRVARIVAVAQTGGPSSATAALTVGDLFDARLQITQPWYRGFARPGLVLRWISRLGETLDRDAGVGTIKLDARTDLAELTPLERAVTLAAVAIAERPSVLMIEQADGVSVDGEFLRAIARLAPASTTIVVATNAAAVRLDIDRQLITVDLDVAGSERAHPTHQSLMEGSLS